MARSNAAGSDDVAVANLRREIDAALVEAARAAGDTGSLADAVRYTLLSPGKRVRPTLLVLTADSLGAPRAASLPAAAAVEMVHAASLALDDLPAMDDADLRRGRPTTHKAFDEATAILVSIALLNGAYGLLATLPGTDASDRMAAVEALARAVGPSGLTGGQMRDLASRASCDLAEVERTHAGKTGALFAASLAIGGAVAGVGPARVARLWAAGSAVGLAFQGYDDLVDRFSGSATVGKPTGADGGKSTIASLLTRSEAETWCQQRLAVAEAALASAGLADTPLLHYIKGMAAALSRPLSAAPPQANVGTAI